MWPMIRERGTPLLQGLGGVIVRESLGLRTIGVMIENQIMKFSGGMMNFWKVGVAIVLCRPVINLLIQNYFEILVILGPAILFSIFSINSIYIFFLSHYPYC